MVVHWVERSDWPTEKHWDTLLENHWAAHWAAVSGPKRVDHSADHLVDQKGGCWVCHLARYLAGMWGGRLGKQKVLLTESPWGDLKAEHLVVPKASTTERHSAAHLDEDWVEN